MAALIKMFLVVIPEFVGLLAVGVGLVVLAVSLRWILNRPDMSLAAEK